MFYRCVSVRLLNRERIGLLRREEGVRARERCLPFSTIWQSPASRSLVALGTKWKVGRYDHCKSCLIRVLSLKSRAGQDSVIPSLGESRRMDNGRDSGRKYSVLSIRQTRNKGSRIAAVLIILRAKCGFHEPLLSSNFYKKSCAGEQEGLRYCVSRPVRFLSLKWRAIVRNRWDGATQR